MASTFTNGTATATSASDLNALITAADQQISAGTLTIDISGLISLDTLPAVADGESLTIVNNVGTVAEVTAVPDTAAVNLHSGVSLVITGSNNAVLDGGNTVRGLFAYAGNLIVNNLAIQNTVAQGGAGANAGFAGGGGAGLGGGLFVGANANVTLYGVSFSGNKAIGGAGGNNTGGGTADWGGGGGLGGNAGIVFGGQYFSGGGGVGRTAFGGTGTNAGRVGSGDGTNAPGAGIIVGGAGGGNGAPISAVNDPHTAGAIYGGGGGMSSGTGHNANFPSPQHYYGAGAGGGGVGGHSGYSKLSPYNTGGKYFGGGGAGGFGGGGGAGYYFGGNGGFGGGGGAGQYSYGGNGGFGGGGGGLPNTAGTLARGGFGAGNAGGGFNIGNGRTPQYALSGGDSGGGGLGAGGAVFVQSGGVLTLSRTGSLAAGTVAGGAGGVPTGTDGNGAGTSGTAGSAFGSGIFIEGTQSITLAPGSGQVLTISGVIADMSGSGGTGGQAGAGSVAIGAGTVKLNATNTFTGGSTLSGGGTLELQLPGAAGAGAIKFANGSTDTLQIDGATMPTNTIASFATGDHLDLRSLAFVSGATATYNSGTLTVISGGVTKTLSLSSPAQTTFTVVSDGFGGTPGSDVMSGSPPTLSNVAASAHFTEEGSAVTLSSAVTITDAGSSLTSATVSIAGGTFANDGDVLAASPNGTITASYDSTNERLILSGADTLANYQTVLDSVTFSAGENPTDFALHATRTVTWVVNDGSGSNSLSTAQTTTVSITSVNDPPTLANVAASASYTEEAAAVTLAGSAAVTDPDSLTLASATVSITGGTFAGDGDVLAVNVGGTGITAIYNGALERLTLTGADTLAHYQQVLDSITFAAGENPTDFGSHTTRTVTWSLDDGSGSFNTSTVATTTVSITNVNDAPTLSNVAGSAAYTEEGAAVTLSGAVSVADADNLNLASATVSITGGTFANDGDVLAANVAGTGITASYDSTNERLILSGADTLAHYQGVLDGVTFSAGENPTDFGSHTTRLVSWVLNDGSASNSASTAQTTTVSITNVNDAPTLSGVAASVGVSIATTVTLSGNVTITDPDNLDLVGATVAITGGSGDALATATGGTGITASYDTTNERLILTGTDTLAHYRQVLDQVTFSSTGSGNRTVSWVLDDGGASNHLSVPQSETVHILAGPSPSVAASASYTEEGAATTLSPSVIITDNNASTTLVSATVAITGGSFAGDGDVLAATTTGTAITASYNVAAEVLTLTGIDTFVDYQQVLDSVTFSAGENPTDFGSQPTRTVTWTLDDGFASNNVGSAVSTVSITNVNDPPTLANVAASAGYTEEAAAATLAGGASVTDPDSLTLAGATVSITGGTFAGDTDVLGTSVAGTGITASYNAASERLTLTGADTLAHYRQVLDSVTFAAGENPTDYGSHATRTVTWSLDDGAGSFGTSTAVTSTVSISNVNDAPTLGNVATSAHYTEEGAATTLSGAVSITDPDNLALAGATVSITGGTFAGDGDVLAASTAGTGIGASYDSTNERLILSGADTLAHYQSVLDSVTFMGGENPTDFGSNPIRQVTWVLNDGAASNGLSTAATTTVTLTNVNDPPSLSNVATRLGFAIGQTVTVSPALAVTDPDNLSLASATVSITGGAFAGDGDVLSANVAGTGITASYNAATERLTLTGTDTLAHYQGVLDSVAFSSGPNPNNSGSNPIRTVSWVVDDGGASNHLSVPATTTISIGVVKNDFDGDGKSDVLWQNDNGTPAIWQMNATSLAGGGVLPNPGTSWHEIGTGDFNGDGKADILWQNDNGLPAIWEMNGTSLIGGGVLPNPGAGWQLTATGDFNGDGKSDILLRNTDGTPQIWLMNSTSITASATLANPAASWHPNTG